MSLGIHLLSFSSLAISAFDLAGRYDLTAYDSVYLALSLRERCDLCMADKAFYDKVGSVRPRVRWVADYR